VTRIFVRSLRRVAILNSARAAIAAAFVTLAAAEAVQVVAAGSIEDFVTYLTRIVTASSFGFAFPCHPCHPCPLVQDVLRLCRFDLVSSSGNKHPCIA